ncbi:hypothetical protein Acr_03g0016720 [Actinidia rufa]|uniref:Uncharacterized protein n=1 Tax=Actinidia rufa TaxID=165716 RepID=A0A7J0EEH2_9ERIC|nr:hypothetical protein Acr_03g0016720 [Actinidia rufa]
MVEIYHSTLPPLPAMANWMFNLPLVEGIRSVWGWDGGSREIGNGCSRGNARVRWWRCSRGGGGHWVVTFEVMVVVGGIVVVLGMVERDCRWRLVEVGCRRRGAVWGLIGEMMA